MQLAAFVDACASKRSIKAHVGLISAEGTSEGAGFCCLRYYNPREIVRLAEASIGERTEGT